MTKKEGKKKAESTELKRQLEEYKETLQRLQAEFENYQKRVEKENTNLIKYGNASLIKELLPVIDSIESCVEKMQSEGDREGVLLIRSQLMDLLKGKGLEEINAEGKKFDHELHEAMMNGKDDGKDDELVLEEFQKGYILHGKVLRPAKVKINKKGKKE